MGRIDLIGIRLGLILGPQGHADLIGRLHSGGRLLKRIGCGFACRFGSCLCGGCGLCRSGALGKSGLRIPICGCGSSRCLGGSLLGLRGDTQGTVGLGDGIGDLRCKGSEFRGVLFDDCIRGIEIRCDVLGLGLGFGRGLFRRDGLRIDRLDGFVQIGGGRIGLVRRLLGRVCCGLSFVGG